MEQATEPEQTTDIIAWLDWYCDRANAEREIEEMYQDLGGEG